MELALLAHRMESPMTARSWFFAFFPALTLAIIAASVAWLLRSPSASAAVTVLFALYGFPLLAFRLLQAASPIRARSAMITGHSAHFSPWWAGHQIQVLYDALPFLEGLLRLIPGVYSSWLRAWGSQVGRQVYWTPTVRITDRNLMVIGDGVVFGHDVECFGHVVARRERGLLLMVKRIQIEDGAFLGAFSRLSPGVLVGAGAEVGTFSRLGFNVRVEPGTEVPACAVVSSNQTVGAEYFKGLHRGETC